MSISKPAGFSGSCLCEAVTYRVTTPPMLAAHCHCTDCRKSSGTGHCTHIVIPEDAFSISGKVKSYDRPADSGNIVSRHFCPNCGSPVYSKNSGMPGMVFPRASTLEDLEVIKPKMSVYVSRAASWEMIDPNLPSFDELPEGGPEQAIKDNS